MATGIPTYLDLTSTNINLFGKLITEYKKIRMFGCASLSLVMCAEGKVDSYYESNINEDVKAERVEWPEYLKKQATRTERMA